MEVNIAAADVAVVILVAIGYIRRINFYFEKEMMLRLSHPPLADVAFVVKLNKLLSAIVRIT